MSDTRAPCDERRVCQLDAGHDGGHSWEAAAAPEPRLDALDDPVGVLCDAMADKKWRWLGWTDDELANNDARFRRWTAFRNAANGLIDLLRQRGYMLARAEPRVASPALDVERLRLALNRVNGEIEGNSLDAPRIAAEYARLASAGEEEPAP